MPSLAMPSSGPKFISFGCLRPNHFPETSGPPGSVTLANTRIFFYFDLLLRDAYEI